MARSPRGKHDVRQLPSGRWQARYIAPDGGSRTAGTFTLKKDAEKALTAIKVDLERGVWVDPKITKPSIPTFKAFSESLIDQKVKAGQLKLSTATEYRRYLKKGLSRFAAIQLDHITRESVARWHADRAAEAPFAAAAELRALRSIMVTAAEYGHIAMVPVPTKIKAPTPRATRPPTTAELAKILATITPRYRLGILLAAYGGLRLSEWRCLRRQDLTKVDGRYVVSVTREARHITSSGWAVTAPKSVRGIRTVALPSHITAEIDQHLSQFAGDTPAALIFPPSGTSEFFHDSSFSKSWNVARDAAGCRAEVREHDLRDWFGSARLEAGATPLEVRDSMGHADLQTTERHYLHQLTDREHELADAMPRVPAVAPNNVVQLSR